MFGVDFAAGSFGMVSVGGVRVFHVEIGAAGSATVQDEQEIRVDTENGRSDIGPFHFGGRAVALTGGISGDHGR